MPSKKIRIRLYADENFPLPAVMYLKSLGISIVHAYDLNLVEKNDKVHIREAKKLRRTIISIDRDFLYYSDISLQDSYGAIIVSTGNPTSQHIGEICKKALIKITPNYTRGAFIKISIDKMTRTRKGVTEVITL